MKKIFLALFLLVATTTIIGISSEPVFASGGSGGGKHGGSGGETNPNSIPASQVPSPAKKSFNSQYPTATQVQWEYKPIYYGTPIYTVDFYLGSQRWEANYSADGTLVSAYLIAP